MVAQALHSTDLIGIREQVLDRAENASGARYYELRPVIGNIFAFEMETMKS